MITFLVGFVVLVVVVGIVGVVLLERSARSPRGEPVRVTPSHAALAHHDGLSEDGTGEPVPYVPSHLVIEQAIDTAAYDPLASAFASPDLIIPVDDPGPEEPATPSAAPAASEPAAQPHPITWPHAVAGSAADLDADARARLLGDLSLVRAAWCVPLLARAYAEESTPALRIAALRALAGNGRPEALAALEAARNAANDEERAIIDAALANRPAPAPIEA